VNSVTPRQPRARTTMSSQPPTAPLSREQELTIVSHSFLFYWWPVWAAGFLMTLIILFFTNSRMAIVPQGTKLGEINGSVAHIYTEGKKLEQPRVRASRSKNLGVTFVIVLLLVIVITNIPLRGLWSVIVIVIIIAGAIILSLMGAWDNIFAAL